MERQKFESGSVGVRGLPGPQMRGTRVARHSAEPVRIAAVELQICGNLLRMMAAIGIV
jgi:hypothetical protein